MRYKFCVKIDVNDDDDDDDDDDNDNDDGAGDDEYVDNDDDDNHDHRGGSRGRVQGVRTPPPEMTCGFLIQLVFCQKKNYVVYWC